MKKTERDYSKAKLYAIRSYSSDLVYYGSTLQLLCSRMAQHRQHYNRYLLGKAPYCTSYEVIKLSDAYIELIKEVPCDNKEQLKKFEGEMIRNNPCVNKRIEDRTYNEWRQDNYKTVIEKQKKYQEDNKEKLQAYRREYNKRNEAHIKSYREAKVVCECGSSVARFKINRHRNTPKHKNLI